MQFRTGKKTGYPLLVLALLFVMGTEDWDRFFPLSAQTDLLFQATGEFLELVTLMGVYELTSLGIARVRADGLTAGNRIIFQLFVAVSFGLFLVAFTWRDFVSNHRFSFSAGSHHLLAALVGGLFFAFVGLPLLKALNNPSKEDAKESV